MLNTPSESPPKKRRDSVCLLPFIATEIAKDVQIYGTVAGTVPINGAKFKGKRIIYFWIFPQQMIYNYCWPMFCVEWILLMNESKVFLFTVVTSVFYGGREIVYIHTWQWFHWLQQERKKKRNNYRKPFNKIFWFLGYLVPRAWKMFEIHIFKCFAFSHSWWCDFFPLMFCLCCQWNGYCYNTHPTSRNCMLQVCLGVGGFSM